MAIIRHAAMIANINTRFMFLSSPVAGAVIAKVESNPNSVDILTNPLSKQNVSIHIL
jgi:hypothetical protein